MGDIRFPRPHTRTISNTENPDELYRWANDIDQKMIEVLFSLNQAITRANILTTQSTPVAVGHHAPQHRAETGNDKLETNFHTGTLAAGLGTPFGTTSEVGAGDEYLRSTAKLPFPKSLASYDDVQESDGTLTGNISTITLTSTGSAQALTSDTGVLTISPATTLAIDAKTEITESSGLTCLSLIQNATTAPHMFIDDSGGNPVEPVPPGSMWRFGNTWKIRAQTFQFGEDNASSTTRSIQFVNNMGGTIKAHTLKWFDQTYASDWDNNAKTHFLPDGDSNTTQVVNTIGSPSVNKPEGGIIYDGMDGLHVQTLAFKRFIDAGVFFRNDSDREKGFRFQTEDIPTPTPPDTIDDDHAVINIPGDCLRNTDAAPSESEMLLNTTDQDVQNKNFEDNTTSFYDNTDAGKQFRFEASGITDPALRVLTVQDSDGTIAYLSDVAAPGGLHLLDNEKLIFGTGFDSEVYYNGADTIFDTVTAGGYLFRDNIALGPATTYSAADLCNAEETILDGSARFGYRIALLASPQSADTNASYGLVRGNVTFFGPFDFTGVHRAYRTQCNMSCSGTVNEYNGYESAALSQPLSGTVDDFYGFRQRQISANSPGDFTTATGFRCDSLGSGATNRWAFYAVADPNYFGGYTDIQQITAPGNPAAGHRRLFVNATNKQLSVRTEFGDIVSLEGDEVALTAQVDTAAGSITYIGTADPGTVTSDPAWQVIRMDESGDPELILLYADGNSNFDNVWDNRAALSYS